MYSKIAAFASARVAYSRGDGSSQFPVYGVAQYLLRDPRAPGQSTFQPRTTKLYDRTTDDVTLDEIEHIAI